VCYSSSKVGKEYCMSMYHQTGSYSQSADFYQMIIGHDRDHGRFFGVHFFLLLVSIMIDC